MYKIMSKTMYLDFAVNGKWIGSVYMYLFMLNPVCKFCILI